MTRNPIRSRLLGALLTVVLAAALAVGMAPGVEARPGEAVRVVIHVDSSAPASAADLRANGAADVRALEFVPDTFVAHVPEGRLRVLQRTTGVDLVERDVLMSIDHHCVSPDHPRHNVDCPTEPEEPDPDPDEPDDPVDPTGETPWGVERIQADDVWATTQGVGVRVCVADTGIDGDHPNLTVVEGRNFAGGGVGNWRDRNGHGTHVAGTVAAHGSFLGVAPSAELVAAKVLGNSGSGWTSDIANGLKWCADRSDVINMSFGSSSDSTVLGDAISDIAGKAVLVAASGNSSSTDASYPARYPQVIAVGATDVNDAVPSWSNGGEDILAPGVAVKSTVPGGGYATYSGTSMASPHVAGVAALVIASEEGELGEVRAAIEGSADNHGVVNAPTALE